MGRRRERLSRALQMLGTARRSRLLWVLREVGLAGQRPATADAAREFRLALEELGTTYVKLGQVGKTLAQADSIARALDPDLDPIELLREDTFELMLGEAERRLAPTELAGYGSHSWAPSHGFRAASARSPIASKPEHCESGSRRRISRDSRRSCARRREPDRRRRHRRGPSARLCLDGAGERRDRGGRLRGGCRPRPLHALEDSADPRLPVGNAPAALCVALRQRPRHHSRFPSRRPPLRHGSRLFNRKADRPCVLWRLRREVLSRAARGAPAWPRP